MFIKKKFILAETMKCVYEFASPQNVGVTDNPQLLPSQFPLGIKGRKC